ncbi:hypothetical protein PGTUg99_006407 [Puccinia graminis f. sp. tritici]|uniref:Uncharacterized protein n=1 Tax=Puccinia graminis f. sp. tritici TaxID=56615 RepID=A0A5B0N751_PUCGR|nr:hypothetical protein PGTUg99_006407 [Puccinia graminis f. sp. tritici]
MYAEGKNGIQVNILGVVGSFLLNPAHRQTDLRLSMTLDRLAAKFDLHDPAVREAAARRESLASAP